MMAICIKVRNYVRNVRNFKKTDNSLATIMVVNDHMKHYVIERQFTGFLCGKKL